MIIVLRFRNTQEYAAIVVIDRALNGTILLVGIELQLDRYADKQQQDNAERAINAIVARFGTRI